MTTARTRKRVGGQGTMMAGQDRLGGNNGTGYHDQGKARHPGGPKHLHPTAVSCCLQSGSQVVDNEQTATAHSPTVVSDCSQGRKQVLLEKQDTSKLGGFAKILLGIYSDYSEFTQNLLGMNTGKLLGIHCARNLLGLHSDS